MLQRSGEGMIYDCQREEPRGKRGPSLLYTGAGLPGTGKRKGCGSGDGEQGFLKCESFSQFLIWKRVKVSIFLYLRREEENFHEKSFSVLAERPCRKSMEQK